jgi:hypothetical protein
MGWVCGRRGAQRWRHGQRVEEAWKVSGVERARGRRGAQRWRRGQRVEAGGLAFGLERAEAVGKVFWLEWVEWGRMDCGVELGEWIFWGPWVDFRRFWWNVQEWESHSGGGSTASGRV